MDLIPLVSTYPVIAPKSRTKPGATPVKPRAGLATPRRESDGDDLWVIVVADNPVVRHPLEVGVQADTIENALGGYVVPVAVASKLMPLYAEIVRLIQAPGGISEGGVGRCVGSRCRGRGSVSER
jgi:hypothetical protein